MGVLASQITPYRPLKRRFDGKHPNPLQRCPHGAIRRPLPPSRCQNGCPSKHNFTPSKGVFDPNHEYTYHVGDWFCMKFILEKESWCHRFWKRTWKSETWTPECIQSRQSPSSSTFQFRKLISGSQSIVQNVALIAYKSWADFRSFENLDNFHFRRLTCRAFVSVPSTSKSSSTGFRGAILAETGINCN